MNVSIRRRGWTHTAFTIAILVSSRHGTAADTGMARQKAVPSQDSDRPIKRRHPASTQNKILSAAASLFARYGFDGVSAKQLATEAGVATGALYNHFPSKEAIYAAATSRVFAGHTTLPKDILKPGDADEVKLAKLVGWFVRPMVEDKNFGLLLKREMLDPRPSTSRFTNLFQESLAMFQEQVRRIEPKANVDEATASMLALIFGFSQLKGIYSLFPNVKKTVETPDEIAEYATRWVLHGLRADIARNASKPRKRAAAK